jgi:hypothetical protein
VKTSKNSQGASSFYPRIKDYTRILKRRGSIYGGEETVYGSDKDLAIVTGDGFTEKVSFIEMKNIRAVLIQRFPLATRASILALLFLILFGLIGVSLPENEIIALIVFFFVLAFFYGLLLLGLKTCSVRIVTDVNEHQLVNVHRMRVARKLLHFVTERMQPYLAPDVSAEASPAAPVPPPPPPAVTPEPEPEAL